MLSSVACFLCGEAKDLLLLLFRAAKSFKQFCTALLVQRSRSFGFAKTVSKTFCSSSGSPQDGASQGEMN